MRSREMPLDPFKKKRKQRFKKKQKEYKLNVLNKYKDFFELTYLTSIFANIEYFGFNSNPM